MTSASEPGREAPSRLLVPLLIGSVLLLGCQSPYHADRGALLGGLTGAGVGAAIGEAKGNTAAGAFMGSAVGALTGAAVGTEMDHMEARHEARLEATLREQRAASAATLNDVIAMTRAGVNDQVIVQHLRTHGATALPNASELITLKNEGVSDEVIRALQEQASPVAVGSTVVKHVPVYVDRYVDPFCVAPYPPPPPRWRYRHWHRHRPGVSWGFSLSR